MATRLPRGGKALPKGTNQYVFGSALPGATVLIEDIVDPECDIAVATMAQLLLQQGKVTEALKYFERAAELSRTEGEIVNALSYAEATRTQLEVQEKYPQLANRLQGMGGGIGAPPVR